MGDYQILACIRNFWRMFKTQIAWSHPETFCSESWNQSPRICIFNKFAGGTENAGWGITLCDPLEVASFNACAS